MVFDWLIAEVTCPDLTVLQHGAKSVEETTVETVVQFECNDGYKLKGSSTLQCLASGLWNGTTPQCEGMSVLLRCACCEGMTSLHLQCKCCVRVQGSIP